jgi:hypothetical protein
LTDLKYSPGDYTKVFRIEVQGQIRFVYKHIIVEKSKLFQDKAADDLDNEPEGVSKVVTLDGRLPAFDAYLVWLHDGKLILPRSRSEYFSEWEREEDEQRSCALMYILGDLVGDVEFRVHILDLLITKLKKSGVREEPVETIWQEEHCRSTLASSPLRRVILEMALSDPDQSVFRIWVGYGYYPSFIADLLSLAISRMKVAGDSHCQKDLRSMIEEHEDELSSAHSASKKDDGPQ